MKILIRGCLWMMLVMAVVAVRAQSVYFYGSERNDLYQLLKREGFAIKKFATPEEAVKAAVPGAGVFIIANGYPHKDPANIITRQLLDEAGKKKLRLYIEYPSQFPGLDVPDTAVMTHLERGVVTCDVFGEQLPSMGLLGIHDCHVLPVQVDSPLIVLAKVVGVDKAEYGLADTRTYPLLFRRDANPCVGYDKVQTNLLLGLRFRLNADGYLTLLGELNGVVDEIEEDLPQATWIADERLGHFGRDMASQVQSLLAGAESEHSDDIVDGIAQVELDAIKVQLSCLDLGKVQDVVDHC